MRGRSATVRKAQTMPRPSAAPDLAKALAQAVRKVPETQKTGKEREAAPETAKAAPKPVRPRQKAKTAKAGAAKAGKAGTRGAGTKSRSHSPVRESQDRRDQDRESQDGMRDDARDDDAGDGVAKCWPIGVEGKRGGLDLARLTLEQIAGDPDASHSARVSAARALDSMDLRGKERDFEAWQASRTEIRRRIARLEAALAAQGVDMS